MESDFLLFAVIGFFGQLVDGAIGMGFGVIVTGVLLGLGVPPAEASASVHICKIVTGAVSGASHAAFGNVDRKLLGRIAVAGSIGAIAGAYLLTAFPAEIVRPIVAVYLLLMGFLILKNARHPRAASPRPRWQFPLGLVGGFLDSIGGGGWGPIVTSTLVADGNAPRYAIGSANLAEFFIAVASSATFVLILGLVHWPIVAGLVLGGVLSAPLAAYLTQKLPAKPLMLAVSLCIMGLSLYVIVKEFL